MSIEVISTQELVDRNISIFESKFNQTIPATDKSFFRALAVGLAMIETEQVKKQTNDAKQNLALTATDGLDDLGEDRSIIRDPATSFQFTIEVPGTNGVIVPPTYTWVNPNTGILYFASSSVTVAGGIASIALTSDELGSVGNMVVSETLSISSLLPGLSDTGTIVSIEQTAEDEQTDESYREEILADQRTICGGGNAVDYRKWSNVVSGVVQSYPYSGLPFGDPGVSAPPDRTIYVEVDTSIDPDGIAPTNILDNVRDAIINDPDTNIENQPLGIENSSLYVVSIRRTDLFTEIRGLDVPSSQLTDIQNQITSALDSFYRGLTPYVNGVDFIGDKNNVASDPILSRLIQDIVDTVSGSFAGLGFGLTAVNFIPTYELGSGETAKSGGVAFVP